jgi:hypothetical protein
LIERLTTSSSGRNIRDFRRRDQDSAQQLAHGKYPSHRRSIVQSARQRIGQNSMAAVSAQGDGRRCILLRHLKFEPPLFLCVTPHLDVIVFHRVVLETPEDLTRCRTDRDRDSEKNRREYNISYSAHRTEPLEH